MELTEDYLAELLELHEGKQEQVEHRDAVYKILWDAYPGVIAEIRRLRKDNSQLDRLRGENERLKEQNANQVKIIQAMKKDILGE